MKHAAYQLYQPENTMQQNLLYMKISFHLTKPSIHEFGRSALGLVLTSKYIYISLNENIQSFIDLNQLHENGILDEYNVFTFLHSCQWRPCLSKMNKYLMTKFKCNLNTR